LTRAARQRAFSDIEENVNMEAGSIINDESLRFARYTVKGQTAGTDLFTGKRASVSAGTAIDEGIRSARKLTIIAEGNADNDIAKKRAEWEASVRLAKSIVISVTVQNWQQENGILWGLNQLTRVKSETLGIDGDFLSTSIEHVRSDEEGTITRIGLTRQDAYGAEPIIEKNGAGANSVGAILGLT